MKKLVFAIILLAYFSVEPLWAISPKTVIIKKETTNLNVRIKYPQGFAKSIDNTVKTFITETQKAAETDFAKSLVKDIPGKNNLSIDYETKFTSKNALSLLFIVSSYPQGAAHPNNRLQTFNFIHGQLVTLETLFKENSDFLPQLAAYSHAALAKKNLPDKRWVISGTRAVSENYCNWYFARDGLAIVFDTYQVAAYVYGPQTVIIPKDKLAGWLRPEIAKAVWG